jgi:anti-sigma factor RsiW
MTGRVLPLSASEHVAVDALLPWYVNGTLAGEELARVERRVEGCSQCRHEVGWLRDVFAACAAIAPIPEAPKSTRSIDSGREGAIRLPRWWTRVAAGWQTTRRGCACSSLPSPQAGRPWHVARKR